MQELCNVLELFVQSRVQGGAYRNSLGDKFQQLSHFPLKEAHLHQLKASTSILETLTMLIQESHVDAPVTANGAQSTMRTPRLSPTSLTLNTHLHY